ncbi:hypothetical protein J5N97_021863 [Dioscorea zingiberensis]|uniref:DNA2/NAM7 helicase helicase domain-containing protein n=1 Tax=Dioscorea zingiberensis TaxID=325984 RepID=A0A9D5HA10_9LILI|nr:hypothetical protein J5N97_021863 [Dioscorea zingiberensis]
MYHITVCLENASLDLTKEVYSPKRGDIFLLSVVKPRHISELVKHQRSYCLAVVSNGGDNDDKLLPDNFIILVSRSIEDDQYRKFKDGKTPLFAVYLLNVSTHSRICQALDFESARKRNLTLIQEIFDAKSSVFKVEGCRKTEEADDIHDENIRKILPSFDLNESQENAVLSCVSAAQCHGKCSIDLIWGPPEFDELLRRKVSSGDLEEVFKSAYKVVDENNSTISRLSKSRANCLQVIHRLKARLQLPDISTEKGLRELCLRHALHMFSTVSSSSKLHSVKRMKDLDMLVIDDAAQLRECETLIPLQLSGIRHAILIGDECQLPAMVRSKDKDQHSSGHLDSQCSQATNEGNNQTSRGQADGQEQGQACATVAGNDPWIVVAYSAPIAAMSLFVQLYNISLLNKGLC